MYMDILEQCQKRHEKGQYQKIIDALEAMDAYEALENKIMKKYHLKEPFIWM